MQLRSNGDGLFHFFFNLRPYLGKMDAIWLQSLRFGDHCRATIVMSCRLGGVIQSPLASWEGETTQVKVQPNDRVFFPFEKRGATCEAEKLWASFTSAARAQTWHEGPGRMQTRWVTAPFGINLMQVGHSWSTFLLNQLQAELYLLYTYNIYIYIYKYIYIYISCSPQPTSLHGQR